MRTRTLLLLATTLTVVTIAGAGLAAGGAAAPERVSRAVGPAPSAVAHALRVLAAWDGARGAAWAHGNVTALADLYTGSSTTGTVDVADLSRWRRRGLRVVGLHQQVRALRVLVDNRRRLVLVATDRTVDAVAVGRHRRTALPLSAWTTHRIRLCHRGGRWLVAEVVAQPAR